MSDEEQWKRRLALYTAVRFCGVAIFFLGLAVAYSNVVRRGGWPQLGAVIAIVGALASLLLPRLVRRGWKRSDSRES